MAIEIVDGRPKSIRTPDEAVEDILKQFDAMSEEEQAAFISVIDGVEKGDYDGLDSLVKVEYEVEPVDPMTFLLDDYYFGAVGNSMWPSLQNDFVELFEGGYCEAILSGSLGWGKSFFATCGLGYIVYQMSCLANPQQVYGLAPGSGLVVAVLSATREAARRVPLNELAAKIQLSPYFKERLPFKIAQTMYEIRFPTKKIMVVAGSTASAAIGTNVFAGFLDEMAFMGDTKQVDRSGRLIEVDKSEQLSKAIVRRMKSRFQRSGRLPGIMFMVSSKERPVAFIEKRIAEAVAAGDTSVFIREYATWDVKPKENFSGETFKIAVGNDRVRSKIDPSLQEVDWYRDQGLRVITVPEDYRRDFESDLEGSLRDIAGIATETVSPFIHRVEKVDSAVDATLPRVLDADEWVAGQPLEFMWERVAIQQEVALPGGYKELAWRPKRHPHATRYAHIDPALTSDSAGLAVAHIGGWSEVVRKDSQGAEYNELAPVIETDFLLRVIPPPGDEIFLGDLRWIIYLFIEHGFPIAYVSMDSYQSADCLQQFRKRGIEAEVVSVDKTAEPYEVVKGTMYEDRLRMHRNETILREFVQLQRLPSGASKLRFKIDHPKKGSKDLSDALAGVVYALTQRLPGRPMAPMPAPRVSAGQEQPDHSWVTEGRVMVTSSGGTQPPSRSTMERQPKMPIMPFVRG